MKRAEFEDTIKAYRSVFDTVRVLNETSLLFTVEEDSSIRRTEGPCYGVWGKEARCENCSTGQAFREKRSIKKFEMMNGDLFFVMSKYLEVEGESLVVELIRRLARDDDSNLFGSITLDNFLKESDERLYRDPLTGAYNRLYYEERVPSMAGLTAVVMLDLDHFKELNDSYGHGAGDMALKSVAKAIHRCTRSEDVLIRFGGDEFLLLFRKMNAEIFARKLEDIRCAVAMLRFEDYPGMRVTVTIGGYYCGTRGKNDVIMADQALYEGKKHRNCVVTHFREAFAPERQQKNTEPETRQESENGHRKQVLVIEDNELNREILTELLSEQYDVLTAENGMEGLELLSRHYRDLSVVILDVFMPVMDGFEFLQRTRNDPLLSTVPVIVATGSDRQEDEIRCLELGASDFIAKPYNPMAVLARIRSIVKLRESIMALSEIEYDPLTGLYTRQAFIHHVGQILQDNPDREYGLIAGDIKGFKMVNSIYGEQTGNEVLVYLARAVENAISGGIYARSGSSFYALIPREYQLPEPEFRALKNRLIAGAPVSGLIINFGYYKNVDKTQSAGILCDRAELAAASAKDDKLDYIAYYTEELAEKKALAQKIETSFDAAIRNYEFRVFYQPQVSVKSGRIVAAEALVRWAQADGSVISPGDFIPVFEQDGLISRLDEYMYKEVCLFQKHRLSSNLPVIPISVNISRNTLYLGRTLETYRRICESIGVPQELVPLEMTESATMGDEQMTKRTRELAANGFSLYMDDFGAGYSSMAALITMPFKELKLDKSMIDQIGTPKGETVLRYIIGIARELGLSVVAEGVETSEQVEFLKKLECDMIQGYYYYAPGPEETFAGLLDQQK